MTPEKKYTERDLILAKRDEGARTRCAALYLAGIRGHFGYLAFPCNACRVRAAERHPLPKVSRPRVVVEPRCGMAWKVENDELFFSLSADSRWLAWKRLDPDAVGHEVHSERVRMWADLLANPFELVEDSE